MGSLACTMPVVLALLVACEVASPPEPPVAAPQSTSSTERDAGPGGALTWRVELPPPPRRLTGPNGALTWRVELPPNDGQIAAMSTEELFARVSSRESATQSDRERLVRELARREGWSDAVAEHITESVPWIAATERQILASLGPPHSRSATVTAAGESATWTYVRGARSARVEFANGVLSSWTVNE